MVGLVDEDSDLGELLTHPQAQPALVVNLLTWEQRALADAFAGQAPAPGGVFRLGEWTESEWGPVLLGSAGWIGARLLPQPPEHAGWGLLVRATVEHVELGAAATTPRSCTPAAATARSRPTERRDRPDAEALDGAAVPRDRQP